ncbi:MBL fold metallo-hydrolase [Nocardia sp. NBC_00416]|uniref:MBL fold metallo-hydrolase n=1 Tax=Nocardia sp. NBC_00416 TaxID=2975991 RepID=UPI002E1B6D13
MTTSETRTAAVDDSRLQRPARMRSIHVGELRVTYVPDGAVGLEPRGWLPDATDKEWAAHADHLDEHGKLPAGIGGLLVEYGERALLIDAGIGPIAEPDDPGNTLIGAIGGGALLENLALTGRTPDRIEAVAFTHLHTDHIGWAHHPAPGTDAPAFTGAEYLVAEQEWDQRHLAAHGVTPEMLTTMAPRVRTIRDGDEIFPGVRVVEIPGHTAGHTGFAIASGEQRLLAFGDALHSPLQIRYPHWTSGADHDIAAAIDGRRRLVDELAATGDPAFGIHFADVAFGTVARAADGSTRWAPLP